MKPRFGLLLSADEQLLSRSRSSQHIPKNALRSLNSGMKMPKGHAPESISPGFAPWGSRTVNGELVKSVSGVWGAMEQ